VEGATDQEVFEALTSKKCSLRACGRNRFVVMDNLTAPKGDRLRELIEERSCKLLYYPALLLDLNPIEEAFSKIKGRYCQKRKLEAGRH
jgi:transposase